ncbi:MAG: sensor histidine kinase, partial [Streptomyces albidoflavus]
MGIRADHHRTTPAPGPEGRPARCGPRDWAADFACFAVAVVIGLTGLDVLRQHPGLPAGAAVADQVVGAL